MTRITINLPLVDARACTGCPFLDTKFVGTRLCYAFNRMTFDYVRLPECLAAEIEEVQRES